MASEKIIKQLKTGAVLIILIGGLLALAGGLMVGFGGESESMSGLIGGIAIAAAGGLTSGTGGIILSISIDMKKEMENKNSEK